MLKPAKAAAGWRLGGSVASAMGRLVVISSSPGTFLGAPGLTTREIPGIAHRPPPRGCLMSNSTTLLTDNRRTGSAWKAWLLPLILGGLALTLALVTRYVWIESTEIGLTCSAVPPPWWCEARYVVIRIHQLDGWGLAALAAGLIGL